MKFDIAIGGAHFQNNLQSVKSSVAAFGIEEGFLQLSPLLHWNVWGLWQYVIHRGIDLVPVDSVGSKRVADAEAHTPQLAPGAQMGLVKPRLVALGILHGLLVKQNELLIII